MKLNNKGVVGLFGFFFILVIFSAIFLFIGVGMHFITHEYVIEPVVTVGTNLLTVNGTASNLLGDMEQGHYDNSGVYDLIFLVFMFGVFIESCIAAAKIRKNSWLSFWGLITIGNFFLGLLIFFAIQIRGWILNDVFYNVITETFESVWFDYFVTNTWWLVFVWYLILVVLMFVDLDSVLTKLRLKKQDNLEDFGSGRFEE